MTVTEVEWSNFLYRPGFVDGSRVNAAVFVVSHNNIAWETQRS